MKLPARSLAFVVGIFLSACGGGATAPTPPPTPVPTVKPGTWSYVIRADVSLFNFGGSPPSCRAQSAGTMVVSSSGAFSIPFSGATCNSCSMSGTITGIIVPTGVSGSVVASSSGSGCSQFQPSPSPAPMSGSCTSANCTADLNPGIMQNFAIGYTLTPP